MYDIYLPHQASWTFVVMVTNTNKHARKALQSKQTKLSCVNISFFITRYSH